MKTLILAIGLSMFSGVALGGSARGYVTEIGLQQNGNIWFQLSSKGENRPSFQNGSSCDVTELYRWSLKDDPSDPVKHASIQRMYSLLLTSKASKMVIRIAGTGRCDNGAYSAEDVGYIYTAIE